MLQWAMASRLVQQHTVFLSRFVVVEMHAHIDESGVAILYICIIYKNKAIQFNNTTFHTINLLEY